MKLALTLLTVVVLACAGCGGGAVGPEEEAGWITLFDGSTLDGWTPIGDANWMLADGYVEGTSGNGYLVSEDAYEDFELHVEFWVNDIANSGVFLRCSDRTSIDDMSAYEINIYDTRPDQTYRTGAIVNISPPLETIDVGGQWNTYDIRAEGDRISVSLNDVPIAEGEDTTHPDGPVALQYGAGIVRFRNVRIRPL
jgi:3-keto-disaccharide hydrolase